jgi:excisionase family DNA binding protein
MDSESKYKTFTVAAVAEALSIDRRSVYRLIGAHEIHAVKVLGHWRIPQSEVARILKEGVSLKKEDKP